MRLFKKLRQKLDYLNGEQVESIRQAYLMAFSAHRAQKRRTGEPYINHPVAVAGILADLKMDYQTIMAALLHDVIEDTPVEKKAIAEKFGEEVAELVDGVSKLTQIEFVSRAEAQAESFRKMVLAMARDIRVIIVKLADRLHNMRTLGSLHSQKRRRIARETLDIFAPIGKRLGMRELSVELEELGFAALYPLRHRALKDAVRRTRGNRKKILALIEKTLHVGLNQSRLSSYTITGREKHLYSIYRKMRNKHIPFNEIMDVYAFRVIVEDVDSCYRALGIIHGLFKPVPERFKDYIAIPKANGYQSLHTTLFGPYGLPVEVQIRTTEMDRMATKGIAAHWLYKTTDAPMTESQVRAKAWVKNLLELQEDAANPLEFIENVKMDLFPDEVYVFTPRGEIMELPAGATAIDFAYAVHTDVGNNCVAVKIDRHLAPLSTPLVNGQTVEVITSSSGRPNPAWLDFVVTSKARGSIRHFLKSQRRTESIALGKQLLKKALGNYSLSLKKLSQPVINYTLKEMQLKSLDDLLEEIGLGNRMAALVAQRIAAVAEEAEAETDMKPAEKAPLIIKGTEGLVVNFATCCYPVPGDPIVGIIDVGKGIIVHVERCPSIAKLRRHPDRFMPLRWSEQVRAEFPALVRVQVVNERGTLAMLTLAIAEADANIEDIKVEEREGLHYIVTFRITVRDRKHLAKVLRRLRQVKQLVRIIRRFD
ncbi:bifunctional GTP diphosphokinase/guanosine-3',5'-bis pyrophosphate 3'-pyrophosphohydrolase [Coxiella burnetii]|uniref:guanosine-3',5'-bis(diphosphate) 3'-diphosphatase n=1 Tax=Coxiella burnetii (strain RSA 493 / Nine Mile phase I) TaxID=227377 RepID=Q820X2_COXBU|nr:bifunctional GTP diphosphokinase/guanosine-3',5'-bis pyrophosphate 3'-pyrophosphohydrolase [Coxiella burnetii]NP_819346.1 GTP pyrophosphokinase [Coxiella burnetii RSA 493]AAO89860.1 GTP pyrophosphokinase [Coxiella burnetii RSA 493]ARI65200.1 GTP pyrophosphokinase [Coxiella burnetii]ARK26691.1 bifunctional GTP diphosphokinase/guanosine-3',5'-bis(diphosphate) 3'-diphosphatase [Coxiella burnetii]MCF2094584.1 bifunctional GTP diphosphokinase/guanosine-3',5'-bis pyrophosphate 3'-pyrophosphohydro